MLYPLSILSLFLLFLIHITHASTHTSHTHNDNQHILTSNTKISHQAREYWMQQANQALAELASPCPFAAFGTVIVNHTATTPDFPHGKLVCQGANQNVETGNPTLHGEISALNNLTQILTSPDGDYRYTPAEAASAFKDLTLYTNAEPCPMCASAIRWAGFKECVFGTSIQTLVKMGWSQIDIPSEEVFKRSGGLHGGETTLLGGVLSKETDVYFGWQFDEKAICPSGCERKENWCSPVG